MKRNQLTKWYVFTSVLIAVVLFTPQFFPPFQSTPLTAALVLFLLLAQGLLVFKPAIRLAYKNFLTAQKAFTELKKSEEGLRENLDQQQKANAQLTVHRKTLEKDNKRLQRTEQEMIKSAQQQTEANEKLLRVQEELRKAYDRVKYSEEKMRNIAEEQLAATERLMIAENKLRQSLDIEKKSKKEMTQTLANLKNAQSQLVQSEKMASLGQLTAGIAHEINNPINFVYNGIEALKVALDELIDIFEQYDSLSTKDFKAALHEMNHMRETSGYDDLIKDVKDLVSDIKKGAVKTIEIVKGLRIFSRLDEEEMKPADINEALDATLVLLRNKTKDTIRIEKHYDRAIPKINCYPGQLNQVFMNIINNGIQAIPEGKGSANIQIYTENQIEHVLISIKDNGIGMSEEVRQRMFEPFFTTKPVGIGTGLGMSITFGIVEKHGGTIHCQSQEGEGTTFSISIPKRAPASASKAEISMAHSRDM